MTFTQLIFGISGTQNRRDQNFLTSTFSVIAILRYPTFPYCFYYIAILQLGHFREIFTIFLASSDRMYLESYNFLRLFLTYIAINWWRNFWKKLHHLATRARQSLEGRAKKRKMSQGTLLQYNREVRTELIFPIFFIFCPKWLFLALVQCISPTWTWISH